jgi:hypothetical protein
LPLPGSIQEFTCPEVDIAESAIIAATKHGAQSIPAIRHVRARIVDLLLG